MSRQRLLEEWNIFAAAVINKNAPAIQHREMRRAFYAGAHAMTQLAVRAAHEDPDTVQLVMAEVAEELQDFVKRVLREPSDPSII